MSSAWPCACYKQVVPVHSFLLLGPNTPISPPSRSVIIAPAQYLHLLDVTLWCWTENHFAESMPGIDPRTVSTFQVATLMDEINSSKQVSVRDFVTNTVWALDPGQDVTQWTFGGSVVFDFTRRGALMLGITALVKTADTSEMWT
jgi:hypothetical protein